MAIINTQGVNIYISTGDATVIELVPTAISKANPAIITVPDTTGLTVGDIVSFATTGFKELDAQSFAVGAITATTFEAIGANTTDSVGTLGPNPEANVTTAADMVKICLANLEIAAATVNEIDVSTYCGSAALPGKPTPGTITVTGYADKDDPGLLELIKADTDGIARFIEVVLPGDNGYLIGQVNFAGLTYNIPLEGAVGFTMTGTQSQKLQWRF